jgi:type I restriction enzyme S subunit
MNSDALWDYANDNAAGTMSKRVKWRDLANYEFLLPPKEQQAELAELLWAMDEVIERKKGTINTLTEAQSSFRNEIFSGTYYNLEKRKDSKLGEVPSNWDVKPLNELVDESICYGIVQPGENTPGGIPVVQIKNLIEFKQDAMHFVDPDIEKPYSRSRISDKDILLAIKGTLGICNTVPRGFKGNIGRDTAKINITNRLMREYVLYLFRSSKYQLLFDRIKVGSTRYEISIATLRDLPILIPPVEIIEEIIRIFNSIDDSFMMIRKSLLLSQSLQKSLINQIF